MPRESFWFYLAGYRCCMCVIFAAECLGDSWLREIERKKEGGMSAPLPDLVFHLSPLMSYKPSQREPYCTYILYKPQGFSVKLLTWFWKVCIVFMCCLVIFTLFFVFALLSRRVMISPVPHNFERFSPKSPVIPSLSVDAIITLFLKIWLTFTVNLLTKFI